MYNKLKLLRLHDIDENLWGYSWLSKIYGTNMLSPFLRALVNYILDIILEG